MQRCWQNLLLKYRFHFIVSVLQFHSSRRKTWALMSYLWFWPLLSSLVLLHTLLYSWTKLKPFQHFKVQCSYSATSRHKVQTVSCLLTTSVEMKYKQITSLALWSKSEHLLLDKQAWVTLLFPVLCDCSTQEGLKELKTRDLCCWNKKHIFGATKLLKLTQQEPENSVKTIYKIVINQSSTKSLHRPCIWWDVSYSIQTVNWGSCVKQVSVSHVNI